LYRVTCKQCGANTLITGGDPDAALSCTCCQQKHHHGVAANACPGAGFNHLDAVCSHPDGGQACNAVTELGQDCPGGHCGTGVDGCTVCRPVDIEFIGQLQMGQV